MDWLQQFLATMNAKGGSGGYMPYGGQPPLPSSVPSDPSMASLSTTETRPPMPPRTPPFAGADYTPFTGPPMVPPTETGMQPGMSPFSTTPAMPPPQPTIAQAPQISPQTVPEIPPPNTTSAVPNPMPTPPIVPPDVASAPGVETIGGAPSLGTGQMDPMSGAGETAGLPTPDDGLGAALSPIARGSVPGNDMGSRLAAAMRGVQAPQRDVVKPSTPSLPQPGKIEAGALFQMLEGLSNPRTAMLSPMKSQSLGGALGTGRY